MFHAVSDDSGKLTGDSGNKYIGFCGWVVARFSSGDAHIDFEMVDGAFNGGSDFVKRGPILGIPLNTGKHTEVHVVVCVGCPSEFGGTA